MISAPRLGIYQRMVAEKLSSTPMTAEEAYHIISYTDLGYAAATLIRLKQKSIAWETKEEGFIRGPLWKETAVYYGWPFNEARTPDDTTITEADQQRRDEEERVFAQIKKDHEK